MRTVSIEQIRLAPPKHLGEHSALIVRHMKAVDVAREGRFADVDLVGQPALATALLLDSDLAETGAGR